CFTTVEGDKLSVRRCVQEPEFEKQVGGAGRSLDRRMTVIATYAGRTEPMFHDDLSSETAIDLKFMSRAYGASAHFPVKFGGTNGTVNFWSSETDAFNEEAIV